MCKQRVESRACAVFAMQLLRHRFDMGVFGLRNLEEIPKFTKRGYIMSTLGKREAAECTHNNIDCPVDL